MASSLKPLHEKRNPSPPLAQLLNKQSTAYLQLQKTLEEDPVSITNADALLILGKDIKLQLKVYNDLSAQLVKKYLEICSLEEASSTRLTALQTRSDVREFIVLLNEVRKTLVDDTISNITELDIEWNIENQLTSSDVGNQKGAKPKVGTATPGIDVSEESPKERVSTYLQGLHTPAATAQSIQAYPNLDLGKAPNTFPRQLFKGNFPEHPMRPTADDPSTREVPYLKENNDCGDVRFNKLCKRIKKFFFQSTPEQVKTDSNHSLNPIYTASNVPIMSSLNATTDPFKPRMVSSLPQNFNSNRDATDINSSSVPSRSTNVNKIDPSSMYLLKQELFKKSDKPFSGDPCSYNSWMMLLKNKMNGIELQPLDIITVLSVNTVGEPNKLVNNYLDAGIYDPEETLKEIWNSLDNQYGSAAHISSTLINRIDSFPEVKTPNVNSKLRELLHLAKMIEFNMRVNQELIIFNISSGQQLLWSKFPEWLRRRWRKEGHDYMQMNNNAMPPFSKLVSFLQNAINELTNPNFEDSQILDRRTGKLNNTVRSFKTESCNDQSETGKFCSLHESTTHSTRDCHAFAGLSFYERQKFAINNSLCFNCLGKHFAFNCAGREKCDECGKNHMTLMHYPVNKSRQHTTSNAINQSIRNDVTRSDNVALRSATSNEQSVYMSCSKTLLVDVTHSSEPFRKISCYVIVDEQSNSSFIDSELISLLNIKGPIHDYTLTTLNGYKCNQTGMVIEGLQIRGIREKNQYSLPPLYSCDSIPDSKHEVASPELVKSLDHLSQFYRNFEEIDRSASVLLLLGRDCGELMQTECYGTLPPYAHKTPLGWAIVGEVHSGNCEVPSNCIINNKLITTLRTDYEHLEASKTFSKNRNLSLNHCFEEMHDDDLLGQSKEDHKFLRLLEDSIYTNSRGFLTMPLPFRNKNTSLPNNKDAVYHRTKNTLMRLKRDPDTLKQCLASMQTNLDNGYMEQISVNEKEPEEGKAWWLPIFVVTHPKKLKPRLVFDSSAQYHGTCLNKELLQGPDENNRLRGVLMRFREGEIGFTADIEAMFYNFHLPREDRNYLRFFWFSKNDPHEQLVQFRGRVHLFGNKPSPAIAHFGMIYTTRHPKAEENSKSVKFISDNFYVDDGLGASRSIEEAISVIDGARSILGRYNIRLHKIASNCSDLVAHFPESETVKSPTILDICRDPIHRTLGLAWDILKDEFLIKVQIQDRPFTKRGLLSIVNSLFDPIGMINPIVLKGRIIQRKIMLDQNKQKNQDWDSEIPEHFSNEWTAWRNSLHDLENIRIPRSYIPRNFGRVRNYELHVFCDASESAIGVVIYLRLIGENDVPHVAYVVSSSKLIPRGATSVPRLELCAAVEAATKYREVTQELNLEISTTTFYTDSMVILGYLQNSDKRFSNYVTRRVHNILKYSQLSQWNFIPSTKNPADIASRPADASTIKNCKMWMHGPQFLWLNNKDISEYYTAPDFSQLPEAEREVTVLNTENNYSPHPLSTITERISSWNKTIKVVRRLFGCIRVWIDKTKQNLLHSIAPRNPDVSRQEAKTIVLRSVQSAHYGEVISALKSKKLHSSHRLTPLDLFLDSDGLLRVGGRLKNSSLFMHQKYPILLHPHHAATKQVIRHYHEATKHQGRHLTHGALREAGFHVERGTKLIKELIYDCVLCRKLRSLPETQFMANLPPARIEETPPFFHSGIDVFGPYSVTDGRSTRQTAGTKKLWGLLLTCMASRAIHIEPLHGLDVSSLQNGIRRFLAIRGSCKHLYSDQGTNFICSSNLNQTVSLDAIREELESRDCEWHFNPPHASHHGGPWERKIGAVKRILDGSFQQLKGRMLNRDELVTFLYEAMAIVNNTPLFEVSSDPCDPMPITPAMLITLRDSPNPPPLETFDAKDLLEYGKMRWRRVQYLSDCFWKQWRTYYLGSLQERRKWTQRRRDLSVGDVVLMADKQLKRNVWPTGIISAVNKKSDGFVRSVTVTIARTTDNHVKNKSYERPISEIILLVPNCTEDN